MPMLITGGPGLTGRDRAGYDSLVDWCHDYLASPYPGPGMSRQGPICPYSRKMVEEGNLRVLLAPGVDGADLEAMLSAGLALLRAVLDGTTPDQVMVAVVLGFPDLEVRHHDRIDEVEDLLRPARLAAAVMGAAVAHAPGSHPTDPWPQGAFVPMPCLVMRRLGTWDAPFAQNAEDTARAYHARYLETWQRGDMPLAHAKVFEKACMTFGLDLPHRGVAAGAAAKELSRR